MTRTLLVAALTAVSATPALLAGAAWADAPAPVIDNEGATVRDLHLQPGEAAPAISHAGDYVVIYVDGGRIRSAGGQTARHTAGSAISGHGGATADTAIGAPAHEVVVELKDTPSRTVPNPTGLPPGFPRPGSKKVLETDKVRVW